MIKRRREGERLSTGINWEANTYYHELSLLIRLFERTYAFRVHFFHCEPRKRYIHLVYRAGGVEKRGCLPLCRGLILSANGFEGYVGD